jgi:tRNA splicing endonuclease
MTFRYVHGGFYHATSDHTGDEYVVRTRPLCDGWMAISLSEGVVLATGLTKRAAVAVCEEEDACLPVC